jgi:ribose transport system permease protein
MKRKESVKARIVKHHLSSSQSLIIPPLIGLIVLIVLVSVLSPHFLTIRNILNVLRQVSIIGIVSVGMSYVIFTGGIDLSVGSVAALSGVVTGVFIKNFGCNLPVSIIVGILAGAACGTVSGTLITSRIRMPPFISTLAMMSVARGLALVITSGRPIFNLPDSFSFIGGASVAGIPVPIIIMLVVYLLAHVNLSHGKMGLYFYVIGGHEEAGRVSGINTSRVKLLAYIISGVCSGMAGIVLASRVMVSEPIAGVGYELDAIASVIIGGANLFGGEGLIAGTLIGAIIIGILRNGLNLLNVSTYLQQVVIGVVIAGMVSISILRRK